ncbi:hypothetical protein EZV62_020663 [Acer yangbiense]|uniref:Uncharacterized protein n=1 Tax=Acer yangbiense TaxID=1000413 RepID=A0A5C7HEM6_9ROSI|nr:hypothetical protein EZV62_020663 [Acer yangbiense]
MSFLAGRLAGKEGAYFFQESKQAVQRLIEKTPTGKTSPPASSLSSADPELQADVLPEVLMHSLPPKIFGRPSDPSSLSSVASKWWVPAAPKTGSGISISPDALNPLRAYVSLPQVTFGPKRFFIFKVRFFFFFFWDYCQWALPNQEHSVLASTANELRTDKYTPINPEKLKAAAEGLQQIGKAFAVATVIVFGGATVIFSMAVSKLDMHNSDEIRTKGRDLVHPKIEIMKEQLTPIRIWAENTSKKWRLEREENIKEKPIIKELSRILGAKT